MFSNANGNISVNVKLGPVKVGIGFNYYEAYQSASQLTNAFGSYVENKLSEALTF